MNVDVNWLGVALATLVSMVVGMVWFSRGLFGASWINLVKLSDKARKEKMAEAFSTALLSGFIMSYILAHMIFLAHSYFGNSWLQDSLSTAFWVWLGFSGLRVLMYDTFEHRRKKLTLINIGNELVTLMLMALAIGLVKP